MTTEEFGANLREYRRTHFLTQKQMSGLLGISSRHVGSLEHGHKMPSASTVSRFLELSEGQKWKELDLKKLQAEDGVRTYSRLWKGLMHLEPRKREEMLKIFSDILDRR